MSGIGTKPRSLWLLIGGFSFWALTFAAIYGLNGLGCAAGWNGIGTEPFTLQRVLLGGATLLSVAALFVAVLLLQRRSRRAKSTSGSSPFLSSTGWLLTLAAAGTAVFTLAPVFFLTTCA